MDINERYYRNSVPKGSNNIEKGLSRKWEPIPSEEGKFRERQVLLSLDTPDDSLVQAVVYPLHNGRFDPHNPLKRVSGRKNVFTDPPLHFQLLGVTLKGQVVHSGVANQLKAAERKMKEQEKVVEMQQVQLRALKEEVESHMRAGPEGPLATVLVPLPTRHSQFASPEKPYRPEGSGRMRPEGSGRNRPEGWGSGPLRAPSAFGGHPVVAQTSSVEVQAASTHWTRFYFPDFNAEPEAVHNSFYQHFDVFLGDLQSTLANEITKAELCMVVPQWLKDRYTPLYYKHTMNKQKQKKTLGRGVPPEVGMRTARTVIDMGEGPKRHMFEERSKDMRIEIETFCRIVAQMNSYIEDLPGLNALQGGLLVFLAGEIDKLNEESDERVRLRHIILDKQLKERAAKIELELQKCDHEHDHSVVEALVAGFQDVKGNSSMMTNLLEIYDQNELLKKQLAEEQDLTASLKDELSTAERAIVQLTTRVHSLEQDLVIERERNISLSTENRLLKRRVADLEEINVKQEREIGMSTEAVRGSRTKLRRTLGKHNVHKGFLWKAGLERVRRNSVQRQEGGGDTPKKGGGGDGGEGRLSTPGVGEAPADPEVPEMTEEERELAQMKIEEEEDMSLVITCRALERVTRETISSISHLVGERDKLKKDLKRETTEKDFHKKQVEKFSAKTQELEMKLIDQMRNFNQQMKDKAREMEEEKEKTMDELADKHMETVKEVERKLREEREDKAKISLERMEELVASQAEISSLQEQLSTADGRIGELEYEVDNLTEMMRSLKFQKDGQDEEISGQEAKHRELEALLSEMTILFTDQSVTGESGMHDLKDKYAILRTMREKLARVAESDIGVEGSTAGTRQRIAANLENFSTQIQGYMQVQEDLGDLTKEMKERAQLLDQKVKLMDDKLDIENPDGGPTPRTTEYEVAEKRKRNTLINMKGYVKKVMAKVKSTGGWQENVPFLASKPAVNRTEKEMEEFKHREMIAADPDSYLTKGAAAVFKILNKGSNMLGTMSVNSQLVGAIDALQRHKAVEMMMEVDSEKQQQILELLTADSATSILKEMGTEHAARLIPGIKGEALKNLMQSMHAEGQATAVVSMMRSDERADCLVSGFTHKQQADILNTLDQVQALQTLRAMHAKDANLILQSMDSEKQAALITDMSPVGAALMLSHKEAAELPRAFKEVDPAHIARILLQMKPEVGSRALEAICLDSINRGLTVMSYMPLMEATWLVRGFGDSARLTLTQEQESRVHSSVALMAALGVSQFNLTTPEWYLAWRREMPVTMAELRNVSVDMALEVERKCMLSLTPQEAAEAEKAIQMYNATEAKADKDSQALAEGEAAAKSSLEDKEDRRQRAINTINDVIRSVKDIHTLAKTVVGVGVEARTADSLKDGLSLLSSIQENSLHQDQLETLSLEALEEKTDEAVKALQDVTETLKEAISQNKAWQAALESERVSAVTKLEDMERRIKERGPVTGGGGDGNVQFMKEMVNEMRGVVRNYMTTSGEEKLPLSLKNALGELEEVARVLEMYEEDGEPLDADTSEENMRNATAAIRKASAALDAAYKQKHRDAGGSEEQAAEMDSKWGNIANITKKNAETKKKKRQKVMYDPITGRRMRRPPVNKDDKKMTSLADIAKMAGKGVDFDDTKKEIGVQCALGGGGSKRSKDTEAENFLESMFGSMGEVHELQEESQLWDLSERAMEYLLGMFGTQGVMAQQLPREGSNEDYLLVRSAVNPENVGKEVPLASTHARLHAQAIANKSQLEAHDGDGEKVTVVMLTVGGQPWGSFAFSGTYPVEILGAEASKRRDKMREEMLHIASNIAKVILRFSQHMSKQLEVFRGQHRLLLKSFVQLLSSFSKATRSVSRFKKSSATETKIKEVEFRSLVSKHRQLTRARVRLQDLLASPPMAAELIALQAESEPARAVITTIAGAHHLCEDESAPPPLTVDELKAPNRIHAAIWNKMWGTKLRNYVAPDRLVNDMRDFDSSRITKERQETCEAFLNAGPYKDAATDSDAVGIVHEWLWLMLHIYSNENKLNSLQAAREGGEDTNPTGGKGLKSFELLGM